MPTTIPIMLHMITGHPANRGRRGRALMKTAAWQGYKRAIGKPFDLRVYGGLRFRCYPDSAQPGRFIYFGGWPDYDEMVFMRRYLRLGDSFVDCGANAGMYTLLASTLVGPDGRVDAFEGAPKTVERLRENVAINNLQQVIVHNSVVWDTTGTLTFTTDRDEGNRIRTASDIQNQVVEVPCVRLDDIVFARNLAMAKLDIEGAEPIALLGAEGLLREHAPPVWMLELQDRFVRRFGWTAEGLVDLLDDFGYGLALYDADRNELRFEDKTAIETRTNVFVVAYDQMQTVRQRITGSSQ